MKHLIERLERLEEAIESGGKDHKRAKKIAGMLAKKLKPEDHGKVSVYCYFGSPEDNLPDVRTIQVDVDHRVNRAGASPEYQPLGRVVDALKEMGMKHRKPAAKSDGQDRWFDIDLMV